MPIPLCPFPRRNNRRAGIPSLLPLVSGKSRGQVLVIFSLILLGLFLAVGLAIDSGSLYVTRGQLQRAVDAAAISAANTYRRDGTVAEMQNAALEVLSLHHVDINTVNLELYKCDSEDVETLAPDFYKSCPDIDAGEPPRKLVWVKATQIAQIYFFRLAGYSTAPLTAFAIAEAAPVDVIIVMDTSESMGVDTTIPSPYVIDDYDPDDAVSGCNSGNTCYPLTQAKDAAKALIDKLFEGYDNVGVVTFDSQAITRLDLTILTTGNKEFIKNTIDAIPLHDDPSIYRMPATWQTYITNVGGLNYKERRFNPANPEDRDGDGLDSDSTDMYGSDACLPETQWEGTAPWGNTLWDTSIDPYGWGGVPCDDGGKLDIYDWNGNGIFNDWYGPSAVSPSDHDLSGLWMTGHDPDGDEGPLVASLSPLSTCTGCGLREASNILKLKGRPSAVWVMIVLSDGIANLSDTPLTAGWPVGDPRLGYPNGFCQGGLEPIRITENVDYHDKFWRDACIDKDTSPRYCLDEDPLECPPGSSAVSHAYLKEYSVLDYAMDMVDDAALTTSTNTSEPQGNKIAIYSIGLGTTTDGEYLLRYMADVGDDGDRETRPCYGVTAGMNCGQYYFAPSGEELVPIFEDIASRIYTKINE